MADKSKKPGQNLGKGGNQSNLGKGNVNRGLEQDENLKKRTGSGRLSDNDRDIDSDQKRSGLPHKGNNKGNKR